MIDLTTKVGKTSLKNPVLVASGCFGHGDELKNELPLKELGGIVTKSLTIKRREGNPLPRLVETPCGLINSVGLENMGIKTFLQEKLPSLKELGVPIIVSIIGEKVNEYEELVEILTTREEITAIEVNVSSPNIEHGGMEFGRDPKVVAGLVRSLKKRGSKPLWIKLTPNLVDIREEARAAEEGGADAVSLVNTFTATWVDVKTKNFVLPKKWGGLSGPAIHPLALYMVYQVVQVVKIPVIGIGGITDTDAALRFLMLGAKAIQIGTANFLDPQIPFRIIAGIENYLEEEKIAKIEDLIGIVK